MSEFKGIYISKEVLDIEGLLPFEKILLSQIIALHGEDGCFASNQYFADLLHISRPYVTKLITSLKNKDILESEEIKKGKITVKRVLTIASTRLLEASKYGANHSDGGASHSIRGCYPQGKGVLATVLGNKEVKTKVKAKVKEKEDFSLVSIDPPEVSWELWYKQPLKDVNPSDTGLEGFELSCFKFVKSYQKMFLRVDGTDRRLNRAIAFDWYKTFKDWREAEPEITEKEIIAVARFASEEVFWQRTVMQISGFIGSYETILSQLKTKKNAIRQNS